MTELLDALRLAKATGDFALLAEQVPYARTFGITVDHSTGELLGKMAFSDDLIGNPVLPALHGGTLGALLEFTAALQVLWETETLVFPKIITLTVDFLRSGRPRETFARGAITKHGRRVVTVSVEAWQEDRDRPIARANAHFLIQPIDE
jgi:acyl-coenzyme A thioesterase PaaI-like protein